MSVPRCVMDFLNGVATSCLAGGCQIIKKSWGVGKAPKVISDGNDEYLVITWGGGGGG